MHQIFYYFQWMKSGNLSVICITFKYLLSLMMWHLYFDFRIFHSYQSETRTHFEIFNSSSFHQLLFVPSYMFLFDFSIGLPYVLNTRKIEVSCTFGFIWQYTFILHWQFFKKLKPKFVLWKKMHKKGIESLLFIISSIELLSLITNFWSLLKI